MHFDVQLGKPMAKNSEEMIDPTRIRDQANYINDNVQKQLCYCKYVHVHVCMHAYSVSRSLTHAICRLRARLFPNISTKDLCGRARGCMQQEREIARQRAILTPLSSHAQRWQARAELPNEPPVATAFE